MTLLLDEPYFYYYHYYIIFMGQMIENGIVIFTITLQFISLCFCSQTHSRHMEKFVEGKQMSETVLEWCIIIVLNVNAPQILRRKSIQLYGTIQVRGIS